MELSGYWCPAKEQKYERTGKWWRRKVKERTRKWRKREGRKRPMRVMLGEDLAHQRGGGFETEAQEDPAGAGHDEMKPPMVSP